VMQDGQVNGVDYPTLQRQAQRQFETLMRSHSERAFGQPDWKGLFQPAIPYADDYSRQAPLSAIDPLI